MIKIKNGIAFDNKKPIILHVLDIKATEGYKLLALFQDGVTKKYDCTHLLDHEAFLPLKDEKEFKKVSLWRGVPVWEKYNLDLSPETIYKNGKLVNISPLFF